MKFAWEQYLPWGTASAVLLFVVWKFAVMWRLLGAQWEVLGRSRAALSAAKGTVPEGANFRSLDLSAVLSLLQSKLQAGDDDETAPARRLRQLRRLYLGDEGNSGASVPLDRTSFMESEASRWHVATSDARYWAGAFTFVGLIGTLAGLSLAVLHLIIILGGSAGDLANENAMDQMRTALVNTFQGMGGAFFSTIVGVVSTIVLGARLNRFDQDTEKFGLELELYSQTTLEPLLQSLRDQRVSSAESQLGEEGIIEAKSAEDVVREMGVLGQNMIASMKAFGRIIDESHKRTEVRLQEVLNHNVQAAHQVTERFAKEIGNAGKSLELSLATFSHAIEESHKRTEGRMSDILNQSVQAADKVAGAAEDMAAGAASISSAGERLNLKVSEMAGSFDRHSGHLESLGTAVTRLGDTQDVFFSGMEDALKRLEQSTGQAEVTFRELADYQVALQKEVGALLEHDKNWQQTIARKNEEAELANRAIYHRIQNDLSMQLAQIQSAIREGNAKEEQIVARLEATLVHMESYSTHVSVTVRDHLAALQAGPLLELDSQNAKLTSEMITAMTELRQEIRLLKGSFGQAEQSLKNMSGHLGMVQGEVSENQKKIRSDFHDIEKHIESSKASLTKMTYDVSELRNSFVFTLDRLAKRFDDRGAGKG